MIFPLGCAARPEFRVSEQARWQCVARPRCDSRSPCAGLEPVLVSGKWLDRIDSPRLHRAFDVHGELPTQHQDLRGLGALPPDRETYSPFQIGQYL